MSVLRSYRRLLGNGPLSRLLLGEFISAVGDRMYLVALLVLIYRESHDAAVLSIVGAVRLLPYLVLSIPAGVIADRFDRRYVLLMSDIGRGVCMVILAGKDDVTAIVEHFTRIRQKFFFVGNVVKGTGKVVYDAPPAGFASWIE